MNTQKLRWKKRKYYIRINCGIMIALFVAIFLLMGFPIVSDADEFIGLGTKYFYKDIFIREDFEYYNGVSGYYNIGSTYFNRLKLYFVPESDIDSYYNDVSTIFKYFDLSQVDSSIIDLNNNYNLFIYVYQNNLYVAFGTSYCQLKDLNSQKIISGPSLIYNFNPSTHQITSTPNQQNCDYLLLATGNVRSIMYSDNFNYLLIDNDTGNDPGGNMIAPPIYSDGSGGEVINNMYMRTADWKFNIPQYWSNTNFVNSNPISNWGSGNVQFYGLVNDFISANASEYKLKFDYYLQLVGSFDGGVTFAHSYALRNVEYNLTDFLSNNNTCTVSVQSIFTNAVDTNGNNIYTTLNDLSSGEISQVNFQTWNLSCSAHLISGNYTSGSIQETYSFLTQISKEVNNTITENNNPYYPPSDSGFTPDINNGNSTSSGNGNIVLNNYDNDSLVIDNGHDEVINTLYDKLVPDNVSGESGLTQRFVALTNANQWFNVMTASLSIFPQEFWTTIYTIFLASLGIIGTAFLLWIVVHIL